MQSTSYFKIWSTQANQDVFSLAYADTLIVLRYDANSTSKWIYCYNPAEVLEIAFIFKTLFWELSGYR